MAAKKESSFTMVIMDDGSAILTCREPISTEEYLRLCKVIDEWKISKHKVFLMPDCEVVSAHDLLMGTPTT